MGTEHSRIQKECMEYLKWRNYFPFYIRENKKSYPGIVDVIAVNPKGLSIYVEIKAGLDTLRQSQIEFKKRILEKNAPHFTARSADELHNAMEILKL